MRTRKAFYRALRKVAHLFDWTNDGLIRGTLKENPRLCFCPITAVSYARYKEYNTPFNYDVAASKIGFPESQASIVVDGADFYPSVSSVKAKVVNKALKRAVGLS